jgi:ATP-dependent Clp endopeptidase proteolytic subunit ClpP
MRPSQAQKPILASLGKPFSTHPGTQAGSPLQGIASTTPRNVSPLNHLARISPQIRFGNKLLDDDYVVKHPIDTEVNGSSAAQTLRLMMLRDWIKRDQRDPSKLKYTLSAHGSTWFHHEAALGDNLLLLDRSVDTLIQGHAGPASVFAMMMARMADSNLPPDERGRCYMSQDATLQMGPITHGLGEKNHDQQILRENANENARAKESLIMEVTGETSREKVYGQLISNRQHNAAQALWYGKRGLVDAVLIGHDQVLTRAGLERYYQSRGWLKEGADESLEIFNPAAIAEFNRSALNLSKIPKSRFLEPLDKYSEGSVVPPSVLKHPRHGNPPRAELSNSSDNQSSIIKRIAGQHLQIGVGSLDNFEPKLREKLPMTIAVDNGPDYAGRLAIFGAMPSPGVIYDDLIYFNDLFNDTMAQQMEHALTELQKKKEQQKDPSHIKILLNSPGGYVSAGSVFRGTIRHMPSKTKVDVIVQGIAASCGAWLLASATGNRLATPFARIMIHQAASKHSGPLNLVNGQADNVQAITDNIAEAVAKASGRSPDAVRGDFRQDTYLNTLEALFYGPKGLLDGILVGPDRAIVREDVENYLRTDPEVQAYLNQRFPSSEYKSKDKVRLYIQDHLRNLRKPDRIHEPDEWELSNSRDPFKNPTKTLMALAPKAQRIQDIKKLQGSAPRRQEEINQFILGEKNSIPLWPV